MNFLIPASEVGVKLRLFGVPIGAEAKKEMDQMELLADEKKENIISVDNFDVSV